MGKMAAVRVEIMSANQISDQEGRQYTITGEHVFKCLSISDFQPGMGDY